MRRDADARAKAFPLPADVSVEPVVANGVRAEWTSTPDADSSSAILYLHGGGYVICSLDSHRHLVAEVGRACGTRTLAIDYRLAPEHPFPAPVEDTVAAYRFLLASGLKPNRIALAGDSAGGGLVVGAMLRSVRRDCLCRGAAGASRPGWTWRRWASLSPIGPRRIQRCRRKPFG
jgi:monoterpene epsilon-lactone hydrolase